MSTSLEVVAVVKQIIINRAELAIEDYPIEFNGTDNFVIVNSVLPQTFTQAKTDVTVFGDYNIFEYSVTDYQSVENTVTVRDVVNEPLSFSTPGIVIPVTSSIKGTEIIPFVTTSKDIAVNASYDAPILLPNDSLGDSSTSEINFSMSTTYSIKVGIPGAVDLLYTTPGSYQYTVPAGVSFISAIAVGGGGGGSPNWANAAGGGGGLAWNNFPVNEGDVLNINVGAGGSPGTRGSNNATAGGNSSISLIKYDPNIAPIPQLYSFTDATFRPGSATGQTGPTLAQAQSGLTSTGNSSWKTNTSYFNVTDGIQYWTVPITGSYTITAKGAQGGNGGNTGGRGAIITGTFNLTEGEIIRILVGQQGLTGGHSQNTGQFVGSGGGGTFVVKTPYNSTESILVIAGGGGGGANNTWSNQSGVDAVATGSGTAGRGGDAGGANGSGGSGSTGGPGAGFSGNGATPSGTNSTDVSKAFINGGTGGRNARSWGGPEIYGGFGGGGGGGGLAAGGGGGYSGGGSGTWSSNQGGGGGGSYNSGTNQSSIVGQNTGNGEVIITYNGTSQPQETVIEAYGGGNATSGADTNGPNKNSFGGGYDYNLISIDTEFNYLSNADQTFTVPQNTTSIVVKLWGAGGGSNRDLGAGGGGGFATGTISVTPGEVLTIRVGQGGQGGGQSDNETTSLENASTRKNGGSGGWPGGGNGGNSAEYGGGGGGGGYTGIFRGTTPLVIAGGGGGGADGTSGGAGGGTFGLSSSGATGGSQSAGGVSSSTPITSSGYLQGASGGVDGGGGGGGYYGGGFGSTREGGAVGINYISPNKYDATSLGTLNSIDELVGQVGYDDMSTTGIVVYTLNKSPAPIDVTAAYRKNSNVISQSYFTLSENANTFQFSTGISVILNYGNDDHDSLGMDADGAGILARSNTNTFNSTYDKFRGTTTIGSTSSIDGVAVYPTITQTSASTLIAFPGTTSAVWIDFSTGRYKINNFSIQTFSSAEQTVIGSAGPANRFWAISDGINQFLAGTWNNTAARIFTINLNTGIITSTARTLPSTPSQSNATEEDSFGTIMYAIDGSNSYHANGNFYYNSTNGWKVTTGVTDYTSSSSIGASTQSDMDVFGSIDTDGYVWFADWGHDDGGLFGQGNDDRLAIRKTTIKTVTPIVGSGLGGEGGGAGGSSYIDGPGVTNASTSAGNISIPGNTDDPLRTGAGQGAPAGETGDSTTNNYLGIKGKDGKLVIQEFPGSAGGGAGGNATYQGGGGAGGYTGNGGNSESAPAVNSGGGAGGRYYSSTYGTGAGGGVGIYGRGADGVLNANTGGGGGGGSGGTAGLNGEMAGTTGQPTDASITGGLYGGGGGGPGTSRGGGSGGNGVVRIIYGGNRSFPDNALDVSPAQSTGPTEFFTNFTYTTYEKPYIATISEKNIEVELTQTTINYFDNYEPTFRINAEKTVYTEKNLYLSSSTVVNVQEQGIQVYEDRDSIEQFIGSKDIMTTLNDLTYSLIKIVPTNISISVRDDQELGYFVNPDGSAAFAVLDESNDPRAIQIPGAVGPTQRWY